ncbi:hypothetical protein Q5741_21240 [Paenibacillus sp. JX-17]|uniref:Uncharacterized protein n=1 Tax=Paenibacillus lacisoli TaxID=3064525 RepID=A0ABT9CK40_9BACL|nr:hypothetical protein [Paenibacillus sp. JX-17]MDO7908903.1 hypothetical protein [Paenibacillus sp. JX-17]
MKKHVSKLFYIFMIISLMISFVPPAASAAAAEDRAAAFNQLDTPYAGYEMAANTPYSGAGEGEQISDARVRCGGSRPISHCLAVMASMWYCLVCIRAALLMYMNRRPKRIRQRLATMLSRMKPSTIRITSRHPISV